jgi:soluble lytic murein transglycosylase-like protein
MSRLRFIRISAVAALVVLSATVPAEAQTDPEVDQALRERLIAAASEAPSFDDRFHAEVWLTDMSSRLAAKVPDHEERLAILKTAHQEATRVDLPPELVLAVIDIESNFDRFALSYAGARGLMQVMPFWLNEIGRPEDNLFEIATNLRYGCTILRYYYDMEDGRLFPALARYNGSRGKRWYPDLVMGRLSSKWFQQ